MNIENLLAQMRMQANLVVSNLAFTKFGTIKTYDPINFQVQVELLPKDTDATTLTGFIPILSPWVGSNWGIFAAPEEGTPCIVFFAEASYFAPIGALGFFNDINRPVEVPSKEFWLVHESGSSLKFTNDGNVEIKANNAINVAGQTVNVGNISEGNLKKLLNEAAQQVFNTHTHSSNGTPPTQQMGTDTLTQYMKAN